MTPRPGNASPNPTSTPDGAASNAAHTRAYQACEGCRSRKVRCVMGAGDVDRPAGPPCNRCLREQKRCVFSETRRKRRGDEIDIAFRDDVDDWSYPADGAGFATPLSADTRTAKKPKTEESFSYANGGPVMGQVTPTRSVFAPYPAPHPNTADGAAMPYPAAPQAAFNNRSTGNQP